MMKVELILFLVLASPGWEMMDQLNTKFLKIFLVLFIIFLSISASNAIPAPVSNKNTQTSVKTSIKPAHKKSKSNGLKTPLTKHSTTKHKSKHKKTHHKSKIKHKTKLAKSHYVPPLPKQDASIVVKTALAQCGKPYVYAADGPSAFDCSGLISYCYKKIGVTLPHNAAEQRMSSAPIAKRDLQPGDLIFLHHGKHVGMYIGHDKYIQAPHTGKAIYVSKLPQKQSFFSAYRPYLPWHYWHKTKESA